MEKCSCTVFGFTSVEIFELKLFVSITISDQEKSIILQYRFENSAIMQSLWFDRYFDGLIITNKDVLEEAWQAMETHKANVRTENFQANVIDFGLCMVLLFVLRFLF